MTYEPSTEIEMLGSSNVTVYIIDDDGEAFKQYSNLNIVHLLCIVNDTHLGAPVSVFNPLSASPEYRVNESDSDTTIRVYIHLSPPENVTLTLQRSVDVYISTSLGTAGSYRNNVPRVFNIVLMQ